MLRKPVIGRVLTATEEEHTVKDELEIPSDE